MNKYTEELRKILKQSELEAIENNDPLVGTEHVLLSTLKINNSLQSLLLSLNIDYEEVTT